MVSSRCPFYSPPTPIKIPSTFPTLNLTPYSYAYFNPHSYPLIVYPYSYSNTYSYCYNYSYSYCYPYSYPYSYTYSYSYPYPYPYSRPFFSALASNILDVRVGNWIEYRELTLSLRLYEIQWKKFRFTYLLPFKINVV